MSNLVENQFGRVHRLEDMGIGGLNDEEVVGRIFRNALASRTMPPARVRELGIRHVKGILLSGRPGAGKTLLVRVICKALAIQPPKMVNGSELVHRAAAQEPAVLAEQIFAEAKADAEQNGERAELHVIILEELEVISQNQVLLHHLLVRMDGAEALDNILVFGLTCKPAEIDESLLRPGRFEVQFELPLPDVEGRLQILRIHCKELVQKGWLGADVDLRAIAERAHNFVGAEMAAVVQCASAIALEGADGVNIIRVNQNHFEQALRELMQ
eukprot:TRINITY_DN7473_c0_g6_i1.p1 TRINITY_DN7473_c0_g6~~TRINITY_DN7473_c0_g6_i1.p1  ORF type:complete len:271 (-),score=55.03 TRINITY_DN7473_c0_g6_i1:24-836(-)